MTCLIRGLCAVFLLASLAHFSPAEAQVTFSTPDGPEGIAQVREAAQAFMQGWKAATN